MAITINPKGYTGAIREVSYVPPMRFALFAAGLVCGAVVLFWLFLLGLGFWHGREVADLTQQRDALAVQKEKLQQTEERRLFTIQKRVNDIGALIGAHRNGTLFFEALAARTRGDVRFTSARVDFDRGNVALEGEAETFSALANQLLAFQFDDQNRFRSWALDNIARADTGEVGFKLTLTFHSSLVRAQ